MTVLLPCRGSLEQVGGLMLGASVRGGCCVMALMSSAVPLLSAKLVLLLQMCLQCLLPRTTGTKCASWVSEAAVQTGARIG